MDDDRRHFSRQNVKPPVYVSLGPGRGSLLFNLSGGGLAVEVHGIPLTGQIVPVVFELPESQSCIETIGHIAWRDTLGTRAGLEFLDLSATAQQQIEEWVSRRSLAGQHQNTATQPEVSGTEPSESFAMQRDVKSQETPSETAHLISVERRRDSPTSGHEPVIGSQSAVIQPPWTSETWLREQVAVPERRGRAPKSWKMTLEAHHVPALLAGLVVFLGVMFILGYVLGRDQHYPQTGTVSPMGKETMHPAEAASRPVKEPPAFSRLESSLEALPVPQGRVVLQVATFRRQSGALAVVESLRRKDFPAFVLMTSAEHYYRVQVGPYPDVKSANLVKRRLEKEGFKAIIQR